MTAKDLMKQFRWFVDPVPDWIIHDPRWQENLRDAVNFQVAQIDIQMKELALEKERLEKMLPREVHGK